MIDQHLLLTLSLREHDGTPLQSRLSEREVACWISNRALRPEYRVRRGTWTCRPGSASGDSVALRAHGCV